MINSALLELLLITASSALIVISCAALVTQPPFIELIINFIVTINYFTSDDFIESEPRSIIRKISKIISNEKIRYHGEALLNDNYVYINFMFLFYAVYLTCLLVLRCKEFSRIIYLNRVFFLGVKRRLSFILTANLVLYSLPICSALFIDFLLNTIAAKLTDFWFTIDFRLYLFALAGLIITFIVSVGYFFLENKIDNEMSLRISRN